MTGSKSTREARRRLEEWKKGIEPPPELLNLEARMMPTDAAIDILRHSLACATMLGRGCSEREREAAYFSIRALSDFCLSQGVPRAALEPVTMLADALAAATEGYTSAILKPATKRHRPSNLQKNLYDGQMAALVDCCREASGVGKPLSVSAGAKKAITMARQAGVTLGYTAEQLVGIRKRVRESGRDGTAKTLYEQLINSDDFKSSPSDLAKAVLDSTRTH